MEPNFWHDKWHQQLIGFHQASVNALLLDYWQQLDIEPQGQIFVPLCGKSLDMCYLAELGHNVLGCELNLSAVEQFYAENQLTVTCEPIGEHQFFDCEQVQIWQGDIFTLAPKITQGISGFYDRAALIAWPESLRLAYVKQLAKLIPQGSRGLLVTLDYPQETLQGPPFAVSQTWVETHMSDYFDIELLACRDVLADNSRFVKQGVPWLNEAAYLLKRK
jgi:thiopurine S-methyltransferase